MLPASASGTPPPPSNSAAGRGRRSHGLSDATRGRIELCHRGQLGVTGHPARRQDRSQRLYHLSARFEHLSLSPDGCSPSSPATSGPTTRTRLVSEIPVKARGGYALAFLPDAIWASGTSMSRSALGGNGRQGCGTHGDHRPWHFGFAGVEFEVGQRFAGRHEPRLRGHRTIGGQSRAT